jgi:hypothetical protein
MKLKDMKVGAVTQVRAELPKKELKAISAYMDKFGGTLQESNDSFESQLGDIVVGLSQMFHSLALVKTSEAIREWNNIRKQTFDGTAYENR